MHSFRAHHVAALDGLRGIAILLVTIHHQLIPLSLSGGFLGVDLFFVLSGFLITGLLLKEFASTNSISLTNFYARRVLRLAPALLLYLIVALIVTYRTHPEEFAREIRSVGLSVAYLTNWRLALGWDYSLDPTSIIWSLSIEEQFYLLWPPLLLVVLAARVKHSHIAIVLILIILAVASHRAVLWFEGAELNRMYYGTDTRADALFVGCSFAFLTQHKLRTRMKAMLHILALVSIGLLVYLVSVSTFTGSFLYLGGYTVVALAAGLLIWSVTDSSDSWFARVCAWYPLRWFGFISYGLYLWHWLLLRSTSFYYLAGGWNTLLRFLLAVSISAASFYLVESRFNRLKSRFSYLPPKSPQETSADTPPLVVSFIRPSEQSL